MPGYGNGCVPTRMPRRWRIWSRLHRPSSHRLTEIDQPSGTTIQFGYDADNNRTSKTTTSGGVSHSVNDVYVLGHLADETDQSGTVLATFTYDSSDVQVSMQVGSDPNTSPRYRATTASTTATVMWWRWSMPLAIQLPAMPTTPLVN